MRSLTAALALSVAALLIGGAAVAEPQLAQPLRPWRGEYFSKKQGGLFVRVGLKGFKASRQTRFVTGNVQIELLNLLKKKPYVVSHRLATTDGPPSEIWKLPSGKYELTSVEIVDTEGVRRRWQPSKARTIVVRRLSLSNLGIWTIAPAGKSGLEVDIRMTPNTYQETGSKRDSSVRTVVDGFTGLEQAIFGGARVSKAAKDGYGQREELRATATFTRQIAMFYKLDLFRNNDHAKQIASVLALSDATMRSCFTDRLEWVEDLKGEVKFTFLLSKTTGTMSKLKHTGGTANDAKLVECMYYELAQIQFPVPENMIGEITYSFDVR